jgi:putative ABC transport system permease protein
MQKSFAMETVIADLRYAFRSLSRARAFYFWVVGILSLGIGICVSVFSLVDGVLLRPLPYQNPQRLVMPTSIAVHPPFNSNGSVSYADCQRLKADTKSFEDMAVTFRRGWSRVKLTGGSNPTYVQGAFVSPNLFEMFGRRPLIGRTFTAEENRRAERVVVIAEGLWRERFGGSADAIGKDVEIGGTKWRVIGVMPVSFRVPFLDTQLWQPILSHPEWNNRDEGGDSQQLQRWDLMARLKSGVSIERAQAEASSIYKRLRAALPEHHSDDLKVVPLREHFSGEVRKPLLILFSSVGVLLLIACANAANLLLARSAQRARELAVRSALGATPARLLRQVLTEAAVLSMMAGTLGIAFSVAAVPLLKWIAPANTPLLADVDVNRRLLLFALLLTTIAGLIAGVVPAWRSSRQMIGEMVKAAERTSTETRREQRLKATLVVGEFALAMVLLTGAGLLIRSFVAVIHVGLGFEPSNLLTVRVGPPSAISQPEALHTYAEIIQRIRQLPGVQTVGGAGNLFFLEEKRTHALRMVEGKPPEPKSRWKPLV